MAVSASKRVGWRGPAAVAACLVLGGWAWLSLREPALPDASASTDRADVATAIDRSRRDAAIALAKMPGDPWEFAERVAAVSPAASVAPERCGQDDAPVFGDVEGDGVAGGDAGSMPTVPTASVVKPAGPTWVAANRHVDAALRASPDPFARTVADWLNIDEARTPAGRIDAVVQDALVSNDPRVYALAYRTCFRHEDGAAGCRSLSAQEWARLDEGNATPWLYALEQARTAGDEAGAQDALRHLATASRLDENSFGPAAAVADSVADGTENLSAVSDLATGAMGMAMAQVVPWTSLTGYCRKGNGGGGNGAGFGADPAAVETCTAIATLLIDHSDTLLGQAIGASVLYRTTGDSTRRDQLRKERAAMQARWDPATGFSGCDHLRSSLKRFRRIGKVGEVQASREALREPVRP